MKAKYGSGWRCWTFLTVFMAGSWVGRAYFSGKDSSPFVDMAAPAGIHVVVHSGEKEKRYLVEMMTGGCALVDYDGDGDLDVVIVNGSRRQRDPSTRQTCVTLYRNEGSNRFVDVTAPAGLTGSGWGMGCAAADYDNDGRIDLFVTNFGANLLYHNQGDGTFREVAVKAGLSYSGWSTGAAFGDYDSDGWLDLYVANYVLFDWDNIPTEGCFFRGVKVLCGPRGFKALPDLLYHNSQDGTFTDVSRPAGIAKVSPAYGFGVVWSDLDGDGDQDVFVANDSMPNFQWQNKGDGTFAEVGTAFGSAYNADGMEQSGMGVDVGDCNGDLQPDLYVTNFSHDYNTLYRQLGRAVFVDATAEAGLIEPTFAFLGFGTNFLDWDRDGDLDLFVANGHVYPEMAQPGLGTDYLQSNQLLENMGKSRFVDASARMGRAFQLKSLGRGSAVGDVDNDGDLDILVSRLEDVPLLLINNAGNSNHWITVRCVGSKSNRDGFGARLRVVAGHLTQTSEIRSQRGYLSSSDSRAHFGLGPQDRVDLLEVQWPSGLTQQWRSLRADRFIILREGEERIEP